MKNKLVRLSASAATIVMVVEALAAGTKWG